MFFKKPTEPLTVPYNQIIEETRDVARLNEQVFGSTSGYEPFGRPSRYPTVRNRLETVERRLQLLLDYLRLQESGPTTIAPCLKRKKTRS